MLIAIVTTRVMSAVSVRYMGLPTSHSSYLGSSNRSPSLTKRFKFRSIQKSTGLVPSNPIQIGNQLHTSIDIG